MKAVLMAGGEGSRLRPLTCDLPKPLVPIANRPVMEHIIRLLKKHGITEIVVTLQYLSEKIQNYFGDGLAYGVHMVYATEDTPLGTAGSVKNIEQYLDDTFLVISGDALTDFNLSAVLDYHRSKGAKSTLTLTRVPNPLEYGVVITDEQGHVTRFLEKPSWSEVFSDTVNTGIYVLEPSVLEMMEPNRIYDFSKDLFPQMLLNGEPIFGYISDGYWCDVGDLQQYMQANYDGLSGKVDIDLPGKVFRPGVWVGNGVEIHPTAQLIPPLVIGHDCKIGAGAILEGPAALGISVTVERNTTIKRGVVWRNTFLGEQVNVRGGMIGRKCNVKARTHVMEGAIIGDNCIIEPGCEIMPSVKIWPGKLIDAATIVHTSVVWGTKWGRSIFGAYGISGIANVDLTPELAAKLGSAYGSMLPRGATVNFSRDNHTASRMIKRAFMGGLMSAGVKVRDLTQLALPVARFDTRTSHAVGGIHTRMSPFEPGRVEIKFFDGNGLDLDKLSERKIETFYYREDYRRVAADEIRDVSYPARTMESYREGFVKALSDLKPDGSNLRVVLDYSYGLAPAVLNALLGGLGHEVIGLHAHEDQRRIAKTAEDFQRSLHETADVVTTLRADLGVVFDTGCEKIFLIDGKGRAITDEAGAAVLVTLVAEYFPNSTIAVPVTAPSIIEEIVNRTGGSVLRTKSSARALMVAVQQEDVVFGADCLGGFIFAQFLPVFDSMFSFTMLLELLSRQERTLGEIVDSIPPFFYRHARVSCPWDSKGKVMRMLMDQAETGHSELIDGIKIYGRRGWTLILPDPDQPQFHIYAQADTDEEVDSLVRVFEARIQEVL